MKCEKCGAELDKGAKYCGVCGNTAAAGGKSLCDGCMGAFKPGDLTDLDGRKLCSLCATRETRRREGVPEAGNARMLAYKNLHEEHYAPPTSQLAIFSLVAAFVLPIFGIPAMVLGAVALFQIKKSKGTLGGDGLAIAGIALGALNFLALGCLVGGTFPAMFSRIETNLESAREARAVALLREIQSAQEMFYIDNDYYGSEKDLTETGLVGPGTFNDLDYRVDLFVTRGGFSATAVPKKGKGAYFLLDEQGELRAELDRPATEKSPVWRGPARRPVRRAPVSSG